MLNSAVNAQTVIYYQNFGTATSTTLPAGWSASGPGAANWTLNTSSASSGYTLSSGTTASGSGNLADGATSSTAQPDTVTAGGGIINTVGFSSITVQYAARATATYTLTPTFQWSSDSVTWNNISYTNTPATSTWTMINSTPIALPSGAAGQSNLRFRWYVTRVATTGNYRIDDFNVMGTAAPTNYYSAASGNLDNVSTWGTNTDGSGTHPSNFTNNLQQFNIANGNSGALSGNWTVSGTGSKIIVYTTDFTVPSTHTVTAVIDVNASRTLHLSNGTLPTLGILDPASTVEFLNLTGVVVPTTSNYGNIIFNNSTVSLPGAVSSLVYAGNFTLTGGATFVGANTSLGYSLVTTGSANQTLNANGGTITCWNFDAGYTNAKGSGTVTLNSGNTTLNVNNSFDLNFSGVSNQFSDGGNTISIINNLDCTGSSASYNFTGTINMNSTGSGSANIRGGGSSSLPCVAQVNNLTLNNTIPVQVRGISGGSTFTIKGNLSVLSTATSTLILNGNTVALAGSFNYGQTTDNINTTTTGSTFLFNGTSAQTFITSVTGGNTFANITLNNSAGLTLSSPVNISGTLLLTSGIVSTGSNNLNITATGTVSGGGTSSYVNGNLNKSMPSGGTTSKVFEVGDVTYSPIQLTFSSSISSGNITVKSTSGSHPAISGSYINTSNFVNRYWTITSSGVSPATINAAFSYSTGDITGGGGSNSGYIIRQYSGSAWSTVPSVTNTTSGSSPLLAYQSASTGITGSSYSGDYIAGSPNCSPSAGTANASVTSICGTGTSSLSLSGVTSGTGVTYQWQSSADGITYAPISGATTSAYTTPTLSSTTYYLVSVGCIPTGTSVNSSAVTVSVNPTPSSISGESSICVGTSGAFTDAGSGTWSSSNGNATVVGSTGIVTGITAGAVNITDTLSTGCYTTTPVIVLTSPATISGASTLCTGLSTILTEATGAGTWSSSSSNASVTSGTVTGVATGTATISYTLSDGCYATFPVTVTGTPSAISGPTNACLGETTTLTDAGGGTWSSSNSNATIGSSTGIITGASLGTSVITYTIGTGCYVETTITVNSLPLSISGVTSLCTGYASTLTDGSGSWSAGNGNATVGSITGIVTGISAGTDVITFTSSATGCYITSTMTINQSPAPITGALAVCQGASTTLSDLGGGVWSSSATGVAAIGSASGIVNGLTPGTTTITYTTPSCGSETAVVTVNPLPATPSAIGGSTFVVCAGNNITLTESVSGGTWSSSNAAMGSVNTSGVVTGTGAGTPNISYTISNGCGVNYVFAPVTVNAAPGSITGSSTVCTGTTTTLTDAGSGTWASSNTNAAIGSSTGIVSGITAGTSVITYTLGTGCFISTTITVNNSPSSISGTATSCVGASSTLSDAGGGTWSSSNANATVGSSTGVVTGAAAGLATITYTLGSGCYSTDVYTINATSAGTITGPATICNGGTSTYSNVVPSGTWSSSNTAVATINPSTGVATGISLGSVNISYTVSSSCGSYTTVNPVSVIVAPLAVNITPAYISLCPTCPAQLMTAVGDTVYSSVTFSNTATTFAEPKNTAGISNITVSGIPTGATITSVSVLYNVKALSSEYQSDNIYNLEAPNGNIINLDNLHGSSGGHGFPNVTISSNGTVALGSGTIVTGTNYIASLVASAPTSGSFTSTSYKANATTWSSLYSVPNGTWTFITDNNYNPAEDTLKSWSITINYAYQPTVTWAATAGLYTNSGATIAYTGTSAASVYALPTSTTSYVATATIGGCSTTGTVPVSVGSTLYVPYINGPAQVCIGSNIAMTDSAAGGSWSSSNTATATVGSSTGIVTGVAAGAVNITYTYTCGSCSNYTIATITVNPLPAVAAISGTTNLCISGVPVSTLSDATTAGTFTWSSSNGAVATVGSASGTVTAVSAGSAVISYNFNNGTCSNTVTTNITVGNTPTPVSVTPSLASICPTGPAQMLVASGGNAPFTSTTTTGTISVPCNAATTAYPNSLTVSGIPSGAVITGINVTVNFTSSYVADYVINLKAPDGNILNLADQDAPTGAGSYTNTVFSSAGITPLSSAASPRTGIFAADNISGVGGGGYVSNTTTWSSLYSTPNGTWYLVPYNAYTGSSTSTLTGWTITINYTTQVPITWSSATGLYTNSGATTAYTAGTNNNTVYAEPVSTTTYTVTATNSACTSTSVVNVNVGSPLYVPVISGPASLCAGNNATYTDSMTAGVWSSSNASVFTVGSSSGVVTAVSAGVANLSYTINSGLCTGTGVIPVTVNALPVLAAISGPANVCNGTTITLTDATSGGTWSSGTPSVATIGSTGIVTPVSVGTTIITYSYNNGTCINIVTTTVNSLNYPAAVSVSPGSSTICASGPASLLTASGGLIPGSVTASVTPSATFSYTSPYNSPVTISSIPAGATITGISLNLSASQFSGAYASDALLNIQSPNGNVLNLTLSEGGSNAAAWYNTTFSSASSTSLSSSSAPFTGTYMADGNIGVGLTASTTSLWTDLFTAPFNGTWNLVCNDIYTGGHYVLNNWSITINYTSPPAYTWASTTGLYVNSAATTAYTGTSSATVYAEPATSTTYTVTAANGTCTTTNSAFVSVNPLPASITGPSQVCIGSTIALTDATGSGTWSSSLPTVGSIDPISGIVTGIATGTTSISYTLPTGCFIATTISVNPLPSAISGPAYVCIGQTTALTDLGGGTWNTSDITKATVGSATGVVTGVAAGNPVITYTLATGCTVTVPFTVNPLPSAITGIAQVCAGLNTTLSDPSGSGSWSSSNTGLATVGSATGIVTGLSSGIPNIIFVLTATGCSISTPVTVNPLPSGISGTPSVCVGSATTLTDAGGGIWSSSDITKATAGSATGIITGIAAGNPTVTYTLPTGCMTTIIATVNPLPSSISGTANVCVGLTSALTDAGGGTWSSSDITKAIIGSATGVVTGVTSGSMLISYTLPTGCLISTPFTVNALPSGISGATSLCAGFTTTLTDGTSGGSWSSSSVATATIGTGTGLVTAVASGTATISYTLSTGCNSVVSFTVNSIPPAISGSSVTCTGSSNTLTDATGGGTWTSSNPSLASIVSGSGVITGLSTGSVTVTYTVTGGCFITKPVTVNSSPSPVTGTFHTCVGQTTILSDASGGGTWSSSNGSLATVGTTGLVTGVAVGTPIITYNVSTGCFSTAVVSINSLPAVYTVTGGGGYCTGGTGFHIGLMGSDAGVNYQLYLSGSPVGGPVAGTGAPLDFGIMTAGGSYTVTGTNTSTLCTGNMGGSVVISVSAPPAIYSVTGGGSLCAGGPGVDVALMSSSPGVSYQLYNYSTPVGSPMTGTGAYLDFGPQTLNGPYNVIATNIASGCSNTMTSVISVTVNPLPVSYPVTGGGSYCTGGTGVHIYLTSSAAGINYQLFNAGTPAGGYISGTTAALDFGLQTATGNYTIVGTNAVTGCINNMSGIATVTTNPLPATFSMTGGGGYCTGGTGVTVGLGGSTSGFTYQLFCSGVAVGSPVLATGTAISFGLQTLGGYYTVAATNPATGCSNTMTGTSTVVVNPLPAAFSVTGGGSYCSGGTGVSIGLSASQSGVNYQLYNGVSTVGSSVPGTGSAISFGSGFTTAGSYTVVATNSTTGCFNTMPGSVAVSINPLPGLFTVGSSATSYCAGGSGVHITLSGSVSGIVYNLYNSGSLVASTPGTGSAIDFGSVLAGGTYTVVAVNTVTLCSSAMTGSAVITISALPATYIVTGGGSYCNGSAAPSVGLGGSASGISYQLFKGGIISGAPVAGTGSPISFGPQSGAGSYTVIATNTATGCNNNMTSSALVSILPLPVVYNVTGGGSYCSGTAGPHVGLSSSDLGISYQLYNGTITGAPVSGTGGPLDFGIQSATGSYTIIATNTSTSCTNNMSGSAVVSVNSLPSVYSVYGGGNYCSGGTGVAVGLSNSSAGINYQLYLGSAATGSPVAGTLSSVSFGLQTTAGTYYVVATNPSTGCTANMTGSAVIAINPLPSVYTINPGGSYCAGGTGVDISLAASNTGVNYQLYRGGSPVTGASVSGTGYAIDFGLQTAAGIYTVTGTNSTTTCAGSMAGSATVSVNPLPVPYLVTGGGNYCSGTGGVHVGLSSSTAGTIYQLYSGIAATGAPIAGTGSSLDFGLFTMPGTYTVVATSPGTSCLNNMTGAASITVNPLPATHLLTGGGNYCPGGTGVPVGLNGSGSGISYQLYDGPAMAGSPIIGTGAPLDFGLQTVTGSYSVVATAIATGCSSPMSGSVSVGISSLPALYSVTGGGNYCPSGTGVSVGLSGSETGTNYQLYHGGTAVGLPLYGTGGALNFGVYLPTGIYTVIATNTSTLCVSNMSGSANIGISPLPASHTVTGGGNYCSGGIGLHIGINASDAGTTYQLYTGAVPTGAPMTGTGYPVDFGLHTASGVYTVVATNTATTCSGTMAGSAYITIEPLPALFTVLGGGSYCAGSAGVAVSLSGSEYGTSYQLYNGPSATGIPVSGTGSAISFGMQTAAGSYLVVATSSTSCTRTMTGYVNVTINPVPSVNIVTGGGNFCPGGSGVHVFLNGSTTGISYLLYIGGVLTGTALPGTGYNLDFGSQSTPGTYTVAATYALTGCTTPMTGSAIIGAYSLPNVYTVTGAGTSYCSGSTGIDITLSGSETGTSYQLFNGGALSGAPAGGTGSVLDFGHMVLAGSYHVVATNTTTTCTNNMAGTATVIVNPAPVVFTVTGGGSYCTGGTGVPVGLSGSVIGIQYKLYNTAGWVATITGTGGPLNFGLQTVAGNYTITALNSSTSCTANMAGTANVSINSLPSVFTVTGGGVYCSGGSGVPVILNGSTPGINYELMFGGALVDSMHGTGAPVNFGLQTIGGTYTVLAINNTTSCSRIMAADAVVGINALPVAFPVTGGGGYCIGTPGVHIGMSYSDSGVTYQLFNGSIPAGTAMAGSGSSIDFGLHTAAGTYSVRGTSASTGCINLMSGSETVVINSLPSIYSVTGGGSYCAGGTGVHIGLTGSVFGTSYQLFNGLTSTGIPIPGTGSPLDFGMLTTAGTYKVVASNATTSCTNNMADSAVIMINPIVIPSVSITNSSLGDSVCSGEYVTFTANAVNGGIAPEYAWSINGVTVGTYMDYSYIPVNGDLISVVLTGSAVCSVPSSTGSSMIMTVEPTVLPSVSAWADPGNTICKNTSVTLNVIPSGGGSAPTYSWYKNGIPAGTFPAYSFVPANGDNLYCVMNSNYYCRSGNLVPSNHVVFTVDSVLNPTVSIIANPDTNIGAGQTLQLSALVSNGGPIPTYQWQLNSIPVSGATNATFIRNNFANLDMVSCQVTSSGVCSGYNGSASVTIHVSNVGVKTIASSSYDLVIIPNPSNGQFTLKGNLAGNMVSGLSDHAELEITNIIGQVMFSKSVKIDNGSVNEQIDLGGLCANGMYLLTFRTETMNQVFHIVIEQ